MLSPRPRLRVFTAAILSTILCCGAILPQKTFSATQETRALLLMYTTGPGNFCGNIAASPGSNAPPEPPATTGDSRVPCETVTATTAPEHGRSVPDEVAHNSREVMLCTPGADVPWDCKNSESVARAELFAMGKNGEKIARARERVLEILAEPNSCSAWFQQKDVDAINTFRSASFLIDAKGTNFIRELKGKWPEVIVRNPYVARAIQEGGSYQTITLNLNGAFFQGTSTVMETQMEGGAPRILPPQDIRVGPYRGGTLAAQVATFLHELGHLEGLLPADEGDVQGRSKHNTQEVLQYCRAEVEGAAKRTALTALR